MKVFYKIAFVAVACTLIVGTFAVVGPKAVKAAVATLIRDQDNQGRHPFSTGCSGQPGFAFICFADVPNNQEYVIQNVVVSGTAPGATSTYVALLTTIGGSTPLALGAPVQVASDGTFAQTFPVTAYADPGAGSITAYAARVLGNSITGAGFVTNFSVSIQGYYVTLP